MEPAATIIIPMHNVEPYIGECLASLLEQSHTDFEAICVDDGSTDKTLSAARSTVGDDPRFIFISQRNRGQSAARNVALDRARGRYVLNLDSDDYYKPETLEKLITKADSDDLDVLYFSALTFYESKELRRSNPELQSNRADIPGIMTGQELYVEFERTEAFRPSACLFMARRSIIEETGLRFEEGIIHEDLLFTMAIAPLATRCAFLNEVLYMRRMRPGSTMTTKRGIRNLHGLLVVSMRLEQWLLGNRKTLSSDFCDAFCHRLYDTWDLIMQDIRAIGREEVLAFRETLPLDERIALDLHGIEPVKYRDLILDSTTFKVGHAIMAIPTSLKDRITNHG